MSHVTHSNNIYIYIHSMSHVTHNNNIYICIYSMSNVTRNSNIYIDIHSMSHVAPNNNIYMYILYICTYPQQIMPHITLICICMHTLNESCYTLQ